VNPDNNNLGPVVGFAWSPRFSSGILGKLFGEGKTVWRGGYQVTYDTFFNNLLSNIAGSSPNTLGGLITSPTTGRGTANFQAQFATIQATPPTPLDVQGNLFNPNIRNPYTQRWSFGLQRELPGSAMLDLSYVGSAGRKLFQSLDMNPFVSPGVRFVNTVGARTMRASSANSTYHSLQLNVRRRYASTPFGLLLLEGSYTYSHLIDNISEVFATDSTATSLQSLPQVLGFTPRLDRANSDNDRRHRGVIDFVWDIRAPKTGILGQVLGGWTLGSVMQFESGAPFTVRNGTDRNGDGQSAPDRPEIGNPNAPINTRAQIIRSTPPATNPRQCVNWSPTGFINPDSSTCVTPSDVRWVQATGLPGPNTAGRNISFTPGFVRFDLDVVKRFSITERVKFEYRAEIFNLFNRQNFGVPALSVGTSAAGSFLSFNQTEAFGRSIRMGLKLDW
jgi:hypothetical protein